MEVLDTEIEIQNRLKKLTIKQLQILLPYLYVESTHHHNPALAYNTKDDINETICEDDNIAMLEAYAGFMQVLKNTFRSEEPLTEKQQIEQVLAGIDSLSRIFVDPNKKKASCYFETSTDNIYRNNLLKIEGKAGYIKLRALHGEIKCDTIGFYHKFVRFRGLKDQDENTISRLLVDFAGKLVIAYKLKQMDTIFHLTSDFQYAHIFNDANGRMSQVIRDCFALHLNLLPFSALQSMSHYMFLVSPVEPEFLNFMQNNSEEMLTDIENQRMTGCFFKKKKELYNLHCLQGPEAEKSATEFDKKCFYSRGMFS